MPVRLRIHLFLMPGQLRGHFGQSKAFPELRDLRSNIPGVFARVWLNAKVTGQTSKKQSQRLTVPRGKSHVADYERGDLIMNKLTLPGFNADASLFVSTPRFRSLKTRNDVPSNELVPQEYTARDCYFDCRDGLTHEFCIKACGL